jgi:hypothetical protein
VVRQSALCRVCPDDLAVSRHQRWLIKLNATAQP